MSQLEEVTDHIKNSIYTDDRGRTCMIRECLIELPNGMMMPADNPTESIAKYLHGPTIRPGYDLPIYRCKSSISRLTSGS